MGEKDYDNPSVMIICVGGKVITGSIMVLCVWGKEYER